MLYSRTAGTTKIWGGRTSLSTGVVKVSSSFLPKFEPKITRISALPNKQRSQPKKLPTLTKKSRKKYYNSCLFDRAEILIFLICILRETVTSYIHSEFNQPLDLQAKTRCANFFIFKMTQTVLFWIGVSICGQVLFPM